MPVSGLDRRETKENTVLAQKGYTVDSFLFVEPILPCFVSRRTRPYCAALSWITSSLAARLKGSVNVSGSLWSIWEEHWTWGHSLAPSLSRSVSLVLSLSFSNCLMPATATAHFGCSFVGGPVRANRIELTDGQQLSTTPKPQPRENRVRAEGICCGVVQTWKTLLVLGLRMSFWLQRPRGVTGSGGSKVVRIGQGVLTRRRP